jgi:hypothetical protein
MMSAAKTFTWIGRTSGVLAAVGFFFALTAFSDVRHYAFGMLASIWRATSGA